MAFDIKSVIAANAANTEPKQSALMSILIGTSGSGKSSACATPTNLKTLFVYSGLENHGLASVRGATNRTFGSSEHIIPVCVDVMNGTSVDYGKTWGRVLDILDADLSGNIDCVVIDSLSAFYYIIANTPAVTSQKSLQVYGAIKEIFALLLAKLARISEKGVHIVCTLPSEEYSENGVRSQTIKSLGGTASELVVRSFAQVILVQQLDGVPHFVFRGGSNVAKERKDIAVSKDATGKQVIEATGKVSTISFNPRIAGADMGAMPENCVANIEKLIELVKV